MVHYGSRVELLDSVLSECLGEVYGGGVDVYQGGHLLATNSVRGVDRSNTRNPWRKHPFCTYLTTILCSPLAARQTIADCRAVTGNFGAAWVGKAGSQANFVDCRILRCTAKGSNGGISVALGGSLEMIRSTIMGCSCKRYGGALYVYSGGRADLVDVLIAECQVTGDQEDGGGIYMQDGSLTMTGGAIRDCEALKGGSLGGGALTVKGADAQVRLSGVTVQGCKAPLRITAGSVRLVDVSIGGTAMIVGQELPALTLDTAAIMVDYASQLYGERVHVNDGGYSYANGIIIQTGTSTWTDCTFSDIKRYAIRLGGGTATFTRTTILRSGMLRSGTGVSLTLGAVATMLGLRIADCGSCIDAAGQLYLRNAKLSNCSTQYIGFGTSAEGATTFQSELLTLEPSCEADEGAALISVAGAVTAPLKVRGLQVVAPEACASKNFSVFSDKVRPLNCSDGDVCGAAATCTDVQPLPSAPTLTTVNCSCQGEFFPNPDGTSLALAPYGFDPSTIGLPDGLDPTTIGLPGATVDYCVRSATRLEPAHEYLAGRPFPS